MAIDQMSEPRQRAGCRAERSLRSLLPLIAFNDLWRDFALLRTAQGARASNNKSFTTLTRRTLHFAGSDAGSTLMPDRMRALLS